MIYITKKLSSLWVIKTLFHSKLFCNRLKGVVRVICKHKVNLDTVNDFPSFSDSTGWMRTELFSDISIFLTSKPLCF